MALAGGRPVAAMTRRYGGRARMCSATRSDIAGIEAPFRKSRSRQVPDWGISDKGKLLRSAGEIPSAGGRFRRGRRPLRVWRHPRRRIWFFRSRMAGGKAVGRDSNAFFGHSGTGCPGARVPPSARVSSATRSLHQGCPGPSAGLAVSDAFREQRSHRRDLMRRARPAAQGRTPPNAGWRVCRRAGSAGLRRCCRSDLCRAAFQAMETVERRNGAGSCEGRSPRSHARGTRLCRAVSGPVPRLRPGRRRAPVQPSIRLPMMAMACW